jgi:hypothetical protein
MGCIDFPLSEQIADTVRAHGYSWTRRHYIETKGLTPMQWRVLSGFPV